jgi:replicative DNA helicase
MKGRPKVANVIPIKDALVEAMNRFEHLHENPGELRGVPTGFPKLDSMLSGLQKTDLIILAARPSVGKTTFALDIARQSAVQHNSPVIVFSLEMSSNQLIDKMVASQSKVDAWKLRTGIGFKKEEEYAKLQRAVGELSQAPIFIDDQAGSNIIRMRTVARRIKKEHGLGLIVIDYLQLMSSLKSYDSMVNQVTEISRGLKGLAKEFDVPVLALSQLSRAVEMRAGKPQLSDLRDSGSIEQDADIVMFLHRAEQSEEQKMVHVQPIELMIAKHRNGSLGTIHLNLFGNNASFGESTNDFNSIAPTKDVKSKYDLSDF